MNAMRSTTRICLLGLALILTGASARADQVWNVSLDTSLLSADYTGPFGLDFELIGDSGNTVTVSGFTYGGGGAGPGSASLTGGASGDLDRGAGAGTVTLNDAGSYFSDFNQQFTPGSTLSFTVDSTLVAPTSGGIPDNFSMAIFSQYVGYDPTNPPALPYDNPITTLDPTGYDTFFNFDINGPGATTANSYPSPSGDITITVTPAAVPEPPSGVIFALGLLGVMRLVHLGRNRSFHLCRHSLPITHP